jgi:hypothetical protein
MSKISSILLAIPVIAMAARCAADSPLPGFTLAVRAAPPLAGFTLAARTAHFSFYTRGPRVDAQKSERFLTWIEATLGQELDGRADYYCYARMEDLAAITGTYAQGITYAGAREIHSTRGYHAHEIVHLLAGQIGDPGPFFQEGLAVALGDGGRWNGTDVDTLARKALAKVRVGDLLERFDRVDGQKAYPAAGSFVRALIRTQGALKVAAFFHACPHSGYRDAAFERIFGKPLARAAAEWEEALLSPHKVTEQEQDVLLPLP